METRPSDKTAERALIGALLTDADRVLGTVDLPAKAFSDQTYMYAWEAALTLREQTSEVNLVTLMDAMEKAGHLAAADMGKMMAGQEIGMSWSAESYAEVILEKYDRWTIIQAAAEITKDAYKPDRSLEAVIASAEQRMLDLARRNDRLEEHPVEEIFENILNPKDGDIGRVFTGFSNFDSTMLGIESGRFWVIAATPNTGKSALMVNLTRGVCSIPQDVHVLYFRPEQLGQEIASLLLSTGTKAMRPVRIKMMTTTRDRREAYAKYLGDGTSKSSQVIFGPDFTKADLTKDPTNEELLELRLAAANISKSKVSYHDPSGQDIHQIRRVIRRKRAEIGPKTFLLVILDGLHLTAGTGKEANRVQELTVISRGLKIAAQNDCAPGAILASHQLNYEGYPGNGMPNFSLKALRDSGSIGQDADVVGFIWRPSVHGDSAPAGVKTDRGWDYARLIFKKNRQTSGLAFLELMMNQYTMSLKEYK